VMEKNSMPEMSSVDPRTSVLKYPLRMRIFHWSMAAIILGLIWAGWVMIWPDEQTPSKFDFFYPWHKSFGMLILFAALARLVMRLRTRTPELPVGLAPWEKAGAKIGHVLLYTLMIVVPLMGYSMSSSFTQSDGVYFFGVNLPELLPKNDARFAVFQTLHRYLAYTLLGLVAVHAIGALKHRFLDRNPDNDVLKKML
jgi:cytochrome b561